MRRAIPFMVLIGAVGGICWLFPLFHIVPLKRVEAEKQAGAFDPAGFAEKFWTEKLLPAIGNAVTAQELLKTIQHNPAEAKEKFSRKLGLSDSYSYFLSGTGRVLAVSEDEIFLAVTADSTNVEIALQTGLIFGNAIRDGTGLLNVNDYPNSQDFNNIAEALNHLVETRVLPKLREGAKVGAAIHFVGCGEVNDESMDLKPLRVVPIQAEVE